ncbi:hypothetical protein LY76DRAFT_592399 [Colletotrichum caudatum]|nr:hypothetical protein LY76DRAFT_592399 [Colletotrichum caudatum]
MGRGSKMSNGSDEKKKEGRKEIPTVTSLLVCVMSVLGGLLAPEAPAKLIMTIFPERVGGGEGPSVRRRESELTSGC